MNKNIDGISTKSYGLDTIPLNLVVRAGEICNLSIFILYNVEPKSLSKQRAIVLKNSLLVCVKLIK